MKALKVLPALFISVLTACAGFGFGEKPYDVTPIKAMPMPGFDPVRPLANLDARLPVAPELRKEVLDNGLTVYARRNGHPENIAVFYLLVASGSAAETETERGYAHFVEHLAFNGTVKRPGNSLVAELRSMGIEFGDGVNAFTSRESTLFALHMPTDIPGYAEKAMDILAEWASGIAFDPDEVEREKPVILEELRRDLDPDDKAAEAELEALFGLTPYADRAPLGTEQSIREATPQALKDYYDRTFKPEAMAIMAVGDIDVAHVFTLAQKTLGTIPGKKTRPRIIPLVVPPRGNTVFIHIDPALDGSIVSVRSLKPRRTEETAGDYRDMIVSNLAMNAVRNRLGRIADETAVPWQASTYSQDYAPGETETFGLFLSCKPGMEYPTLERVSAEVSRLLRHGLTDFEFGSLVRDWRRFTETLDRQSHDMPSGAFADEYVRNYLHGEPIPGVVNEYPLQTAILDTLTKTDIDGAFSAILDFRSSMIAVRAPRDASEPFSRETLIKALDSGRDVDMVALPDIADSKDIFLSLPAPGNIVSERTLESGIVEFILSNDIRVLAKRTDFTPGSVEFMAVAPGGMTSYPPGEMTVLSLLEPFERSLAYDGITASDLDRAAGETAIRYDRTVSDTFRLISGSAGTKELNTLLRIAHVSSYPTDVNEDMFLKTGQGVADALQDALMNQGYRFESEFNSFLYSGSKRKGALSPDNFLTLTPAKFLELERTLYGNPSEFTYIFVGDLDMAAFRASLEAHVSSFPATKPVPMQTLEPDMVRTGPGRIVYPYMKENRASVRMIFAGRTEWSTERANRVQLLGPVLQNILLDLVREKLGGTYTLSAGGSLDREPVGQYLFHVTFDTAPEKVDNLISSIESEIALMRKDGIPPQYVAQIRENVRRTVETQLRTNSFWTGRIANAVLAGEDFDIEKTAREIVDSVTAEILSETIREFLVPEREFVFIMAPK